MLGRTSFKSALVAAVACAVVGSMPATVAFAKKAPAEDLAAVKALDQRAVLDWPHSIRALAYRHFDLIGKFTIVKKGTKVYPLPRGKQVADVPFTFEGARYNVASFMKDNSVSGLLVLHNGKIVMERYALGRTSKDHWPAYSVTKSISSTLVGAAVKDGYIGSIDDMVSKYIPELKGSTYDRVSIRNMLMMASGVEWNENLSDPKNDLTTLWDKSFIDNMKGRKFVSEPGKSFLYRTGDANLFGVLLSRATGMPVSQYLSKKIWVPFGMAADARMHLINGEEVAGGGLEMTLRDFGRFGQFMLEGGKIDGKPVLPDGWIEDATRAHLPTGWGDVGYGYLWWIPPGGEAYMAIGIFGQGIYINPKKNLVVVINSAWPEGDYAPGYAREFAFIKQLESTLP